MGYVTAFASQKWWDSFPVVPFHDWEFLHEFATRHYIVGVLYFIVAVIDKWTFYNYPMQRNIILAKNERSTRENNKLLELA